MESEQSPLKFTVDVKARESALSQSQRRKQMLEKQKKRRKNLLANVRELAMSTSIDPPNTADQDDQDDMTAEEMQSTENNPTNTDSEMKVEQSESKHKKRLKYSERLLEELHKNQLMIPELLEEIPIDLPSNWLCIPVPAGVRCLVISSNSTTVARGQDGKLIKKFSSFLPGGSNSTSGGRKDSYSVFDCIFHEPSNTFYVIDMMCWKSNLYYDCDTEFRFFFRLSKFAEIPQVMTASSRNQYRFLSLIAYNCTKPDLHKAVVTPICGLQPETLLFYAKETNYFTGESNPLFCHLPISQFSVIEQSAVL